MAGPPTGIIVDNLSYTHEAMVDAILENPAISQNDLAALFGYTASWISLIVRSDSFREQLAARKGQLLDPNLSQALEDRLTALAHRSVDVLLEQLDIKGSPEVALKALELTTRAKGYGAGVNLQQTFVVAMPQKAGSADEWVQLHNPQKRTFSVDTVIDAEAA